MKPWRVALAGIVLGGSLVISGLGLAAPQEDRGTTDQSDDLMARYHIYPAFNKLSRGVGNAMGGWLEIPLNVQQRYVPQDPVTSVFAGTLIGSIKGVARTAVGLYEVASFWLPLPEDFAPILPPLDYFNQDKTKYRGVL